MKTTLLGIFLVTVLAINAVLGQTPPPKKTTVAEDYDLSYDYDKKLWSGKPYVGKGKLKLTRYFVVPYKTQQRISICNLKKGLTAVIKATSVTLTPETGEKTKGDPESFKKPECEVIFLSNPIESDEVYYTLTIKDADKVVHESTVMVKVFRGLKIDLSTGVVFHNVSDEKFHYTSSGNDFSLSKDGKTGKVFPISPVILTHAYFRTRGFATIGSTLGLGITDDSKLGYYIGLAGIFGDHQRVVFSGGLALRPAKILKGQYKEGQVFTAADKPEIGDLMEDRYRPGVFLSLSYNLTSKIEKK